MAINPSSPSVSSEVGVASMRKNAIDAQDAGNDPHKEAALNFLKQQAEKFGKTDGRCRLVLTNSSHTAIKLKAWRRFFGWLAYKGREYAGNQLHQKLHVLGDLCTTKEDKALFDHFLGRIQTGKARVHDLRRLNELMQRVTHQAGGVKIAYGYMRLCAQKLSQMPSGKHIVLSKRNDGMRSKWITSGARKEEAGKWFDAIFSPAEKLLEGCDRSSEAYLAYNYYKGRLQRGELRSHEFACLYSAFEAARATQTVRRVCNLVDQHHRPGHVLTWSRDDNNFHLIKENTADTAEMKEAGKRLHQALKDYRFYKLPEVIQRDFAAMSTRMKEGRVTSEDLRYLSTVLNRYARPIKSATNMVIKLAHAAKHQNPNAPLGWDANSQDFAFGDATHSQEAAQRLEWMLAPLAKLVDNKPSQRAVDKAGWQTKRAHAGQLRDKIVNGNGTAGDMIELRKGVEWLYAEHRGRDRFTKAVSDFNEQHKDGPAEAALEALRSLDASESNRFANGESVYTKLTQVREMVQEHQGDSISEFDRFSKLVNDNDANGDDIKELQSIILNAKEARFEQMVSRVKQEAIEEATEEPLVDPYGLKLDVDAETQELALKRMQSNPNILADTDEMLEQFLMLKKQDEQRQDVATQQDLEQQVLRQQINNLEIADPGKFASLQNKISQRVKKNPSSRLPPMGGPSGPAITPSTVEDADNELMRVSINLDGDAQNTPVATDAANPLVTPLPMAAPLPTQPTAQEVVEETNNATDQAAPQPTDTESTLNTLEPNQATSNPNVPVLDRTPSEITGAEDDLFEVNGEQVEDGSNDGGLHFTSNEYAASESNDAGDARDPADTVVPNAATTDKPDTPNVVNNEEVGQDS